MQRYNHTKIEKKWQQKWEESDANAIDKDATEKPKFYLLDMYPYPSGDGLHMGHTEAYTANDIFSRYKKSRGFNVLHPTGFDSFGLPAENYAIKTGTHPKETTKTNSENFTRQLKSLAIDYDYKEMVTTSNPDYYKWTQWLFIQFFKNGLVYKKTDTVNWCESCKTVLANEQVESGACERCGSEVVQKAIPSWFFKITDFAEELISGHEKIDWPEHTKKNQINWIGKSEGAEISFKLIANGLELKKTVEVFTTRPDTLFGATYMVLAPEHELVEKLKDTIENYKDVEVYVKTTNKKTDLERTVETKEKTGIELEGIKAINPVNNEEIPIFIADYVLAHYGTGAIMAVPKHDLRDNVFAKSKNLEIKEVIIVDDSNLISSNVGERGSVIETAKKNVEASKEILSDVYSGGGILINSGEFNGMNNEEAKKKITEFVGGKMKTTYKIRDWSISRQRYWGAPIPIVYDPKGKAHVVPDEHLPWLLPEDVDFIPTGESPLTESKELKERTEKIFGEGWTPEVDTMDTFVCSSWYFLRYPDPHNSNEFCSKKRLKHWLPVDLYIGGAEHTYLHLMYARFFTKAMKKIGLLDFDEPFLKLRHQGMVLDENGVKMSKSKGNVVSPDSMVERFGADAVRMYMMFASPLADEVLWNENGIVGTLRFLERIWKLQEKMSSKSDVDIEVSLHKLIKKVGKDIENLKFNTAIAAMMSFLNEADKKAVTKEQYLILVRLLAPFAPHITEELWSKMGEQDVSIHTQEWPLYEEALTKDTNAIIAVQINGKLRGSITVLINSDEDSVLKIAREEGNLKKWFVNEPSRIIYVPNKLINLVFKP
ncbi:MAG: leucine--tRNA ligase [Candidatus Pacebacteria bacterium]|nr:leucine--tRNA ligase [Candidatus Paceibacterota bacterium]